MREGPPSSETWSPDSGTPPPFTPEYGAPAQAQEPWDPHGDVPPPLENDIPDPEGETPRVVHKGVSEMQERSIEDPVLLSEREYSKKFLASERKKIAEMIHAERKKSHNQLAKLGVSLDLEEILTPEEEGNIAVLSHARAEEATLLAERLGGSSELTAEDVVEERANIKMLVENDEKLGSLKAKIAEHYARADELAKEKFTNFQKSVDQTILRNNAFIVHAFLTREEFRHNELSNVEKRATLEDDINLLLSLEPSISTSSVIPGSGQGLWENNVGVILGGGDIAGAEQGDAGSYTTGIKGRKIIGQEGISQTKIDAIISKRGDDKGYNEIIVDNPKIFGMFKTVAVDPSGKMRGDVAAFEEYVSLAEQKGIPVYVMTPDRRIFEFIAIHTDGDITTGSEITPEQVARGKAGLPGEKRKEIGEEVLSKHLFKKIHIHKEAEKILASLDGSDRASIEISREEYLAQLKNNPGSISRQLREVPESFKNDKSFMLETAMHTEAAFVYEQAGEDLKSDPDFIKQIYALRSGQNKRDVYTYMPEALKKDEEMALLAIENDDFDALDASLASSPSVWEKICDRLIERTNIYKWSEMKEGDTQVYSPYLSMRGDNYSNVNLSERFTTDEVFIHKLNERYPDFQFKVDEYKQFRVTKVV
ncbi:MAG: hypothetical protein A2675_00635 [Candidatus Yonathbacteria bacterium RIFCSPHIGHO2_01_FULL_51_10]|uniref:Uncharacterized protein n=1 Tax=Candidatus Yonathbacteria bacterium RIFCSPHIGHO2_01_FULL_51_10 TaxID=1802723 RepID=A0A1G2S4K8_9BACT|nr:MAG: hypothetical protein A2675_00635 [Candidatus Yonathbacteria bacterium RIFCSPHIGHO2_01_FULL_51_10]